MQKLEIKLNPADRYDYVDSENVRIKVMESRNKYQFIGMTGPKGGRNVTGGPVVKQFAFVFPSAICICADPSQNTSAEFKDAPVIRLGEQFEIAGLGAHHLEKYAHSDNLCLVREADGFRSGY